MKLHTVCNVAMNVIRDSLVQNPWWEEDGLGGKGDGSEAVAAPV